MYIYQIFRYRYVDIDIQLYSYYIRMNLIMELLLFKNNMYKNFIKFIKYIKFFVDNVIQIKIVNEVV